MPVNHKGRIAIIFNAAADRHPPQPLAPRPLPLAGTVVIARAAAAADATQTVGIAVRTTDVADAAAAGVAAVLEIPPAAKQLVKLVAQVRQAAAPKGLGP